MTLYFNIGCTDIALRILILIWLGCHLVLNIDDRYGSLGHFRNFQRNPAMYQLQLYLKGLPPALWPLSQCRVL
jgi:hypothetical protein